MPDRFLSFGAEPAGRSRRRLTRAVLDALPVLAGYLDREERYLFANRAYEAWFDRPLDQIVGRRISEVMPPAAYALNGPRLKRALAGEEVEYRQEAPYPSGMRHVHVRLIPDLTEAGVRGVFALVIDETERLRAEAVAAESERRLAAIAANLPSAMVYQMTAEVDGTRRFTFVADTCEALNGVPAAEALADSGALYGLIHPDDLPGMIAAEADAIAADAPFDHTVRFRRPDGAIRWHRIVSASRLARDGSRVWDGVQIDVTDSKRAEARQQVLVNELNHRVKNTLATVQSLAAQTARVHADPAAFMTSFTGRLMALSRAQNLLTREDWRGASLGDVVGAALEPYGAERIRADGASLLLSPEAAVSFSLALHELATNAAKYGALNAPGGQVAVTWSVDDGVATLRWTERGGPPAPEPAERGFGSRLIERTLSHDLDGRAEFLWSDEGLQVRLAAPLPALTPA